MFELVEPESGVVDTGTARVWAGRDGLVYFQMRVESRWELADSEKAMRAIRQVAGGRPATVVIGTGPFTSASTEARGFWALPEVARDLRAMAVVVRSPVARIIVNLFMRLAGPPYPARMFDTVDHATEWASSWLPS